MRIILVLLVALLGCGKEEKPAETQTVTNTQKVIKIPIELDSVEKELILSHYIAELSKVHAKQKQVLDEWNRLREEIKSNPDSRVNAAHYVAAFERGKRDMANLQEVIESNMILYSSRLDLLDIDASKLKKPAPVLYGESFAKTAAELKAKFKLD